MSSSYRKVATTLLPVPDKLLGRNFSFPHKKSTLRGTKQCPACGQMNGNRSLACRNIDCELRKKALEQNAKKSMDPIQLKSFTSTRIYSVRSKEREFAPRNFVHITDTTLLSEETSSIVSRNAICFIDTCKYDANDVNISCKHVQNCLSSSKVATECRIKHEVLWNLAISLDQKMRLWEMYKEDETKVPAVQCLSATTFVVKCAKSHIFPAGRLHVTAFSNDNSTKKATYSCACKKLKIVLSPNNSVDVKGDVCDHLLLVLAAVLSENEFEKKYGNFIKELKSFWFTEVGFDNMAISSQDESYLSSLPLPAKTASKAVNSNSFENFESTISLGGSNADDDIFIFDNDLLVNEDLVDFPDNIVKSVLDLQNNQNFLGNSSTSLYHQMDPNMVSSCCSAENSNDSLDNMVLSSCANFCCGVEEINGTQLEFSDCNIELMDQFQLTDHIDLCNEDIILSNSDLFQNNDITMPNDFSSDALINNCLELSSDNGQLMKPVAVEYNKEKTCHAPNLVRTNVPAKVQSVDMQFIAKPILLEVKRPRQKNCIPLATTEIKDKLKSVEPGPALGYSAWLEHVIETINISVDVDAKEPNVLHSFHVHEEVFEHFSKSFSTGVKRRLPTHTCVLKKGKYKGLIKYSYIFHTPSTIQRIFKTSNVSIEIERMFESTCDGYIPYVKKVRDAVEAKYKRIYPKLSLYAAYIWFDCSTNNCKTGFKIDWIPNVFPKSRFGILNIEFSLGFKHPS